MKILITGDFCPVCRTEPLLKAGQVDTLFGNFLPIIQNADFAITNLEAPLVSTLASPIFKIGPLLKGLPHTARFLKDAGFHAVTLANNHFRDYGDEGIADTLQLCDEVGLKHVGGGSSLQNAALPLIINTSGCSIGILNACEHEFSIAENTHGGANPIDPLNLFQDLQSVKGKTHYRIIILHGGVETYRLPSIEMKRLSRFLVDTGADLVVWHHSHCFSGMEEYHSKKIFYGLGNFIFDWKGKRNSDWNFGIALSLEFRNDQFICIPHFYQQSNQSAGIRLLNNEEREIKEAEFLKLSQLVENDELLEQEIQKFAYLKRNEYCSALEIFPGRITNFLRRKRLLPSFLTLKQKIWIRNLLLCESHRAILSRILEK